MPLLLAVGHVTHDVLGDGVHTGGAASYAALCARRLGWQAAVVSRAGSDFDAARELPGIRTSIGTSAHTTCFVNEYRDGRRHQRVAARADPIEPAQVPNELRAADVVLLCPVAGELPQPLAGGFSAGLVGAVAQGWLREVRADGRVVACRWKQPERHLAGVDVVFVSERDPPGGVAEARALSAYAPLVVVTRGVRGAELVRRDGTTEVAAFPAREIDPTGAGDVFAAAFLVRYHESHDPVDAAGFAACAASCAVEGVGTSSLGDRAEVARRWQLWKAGPGAKGQR